MENLINELAKLTNATIIVEQLEKIEIIKNLNEKFGLHNFKVITKNELMEKFWNGSPKELAIELQLKYPQITRNEILFLIENIPFIYGQAITEKYQLVKRDIENYYDTNKEIKLNQPIIFFSLTNDNTYHYLVKKINPKININLEQSNIQKEIKINSYDLITDEVIGTLNKIAKLLAEGIESSEIKIICNNPNYYYYLQIFSPIFALRLKKIAPKKIIHLKEVEDFLTYLQQSTNLTESLKYLAERVPANIYDQILSFSQTFSKYQEDFSPVFSIYCQELKQLNIEEERNNYIEVLENSQVSLFNEKKLFILGFTSTYYPKYTEKFSLFSEKEKIKYGYLAKSAEINLVTEMLEHLLMSKHEITYSMTRFIETEELEPYHSDYIVVFVKEQSDLQSEIYSKRLATLFNGKYNEKFINDWRGPISTKINTRKLSATAIETYAKCPFEFYLQKVLHLEKAMIYQQEKAAALGNFVHQSLEKSLSSHKFTLSQDFLKAGEKLKKSDELYLEKYEEKIHEIVENELKKPIVGKEYYEHELVEKLADFTYVGKIDRLKIEEKNRAIYYSIIDYKTGDTKVSTDYLAQGLNIQPFYYSWLVKKSEEHLNFQPREIIIHNVSIKPIKKLPKKELYSAVGIEKNEYITKPVSSEIMEKYLQITEKAIIDLSSEIKMNKFPIAPKKDGNKDLSCEYCQYREICYRQNRNYINLEKEKI